MDQQEQGAAIYMPEHKAEHTERAPKPKLTKAERRELQERQRAAKLASRGSGGGQATSSSGPKVAQGAATPPPTTSSKTASTQVIPSFMLCTVEWTCRSTFSWIVRVKGVLSFVTYGTASSHVFWRVATMASRTVCTATLLPCTALHTCGS